jgi:hypothetical protein
LNNPEGRPVGPQLRSLKFRYTLWAILSKMVLPILTISVIKILKL